MAEADFTVLTDSTATSALARGVTSGISPPDTSTFVYAFNSKTADAAVAGLHYTAVSFAPMAEGGSVRCAVKRGQGGGRTGFSPLLFLLAGNDDVFAQGYLLGLSDEDPSRIVLRKGAINGGVPASDDDSGLLRRSDETFDWDVWFHLRLDAIVNDNGDVVLNVFRSSSTLLAADDPPVWLPVEGMASFTDDHLGINSGSAPFTSGYAGFAFTSSAAARRGYFDRLQIERQT